MIEQGHSVTISIQELDGSWKGIDFSGKDESVSFSGLYLPRSYSFSVPVKMIYPLDSRDILTNLYRASTGNRCPGSWKTKRLRKKREKALSNW